MSKDEFSKVFSVSFCCFGFFSLEPGHWAVFLSVVLQTEVVDVFSILWDKGCRSQHILFRSCPFYDELKVVPSDVVGCHKGQVSPNNLFELLDVRWLEVDEILIGLLQHFQVYFAEQEIGDHVCFYLWITQLRAS